MAGEQSTRRGRGRGRRGLSQDSGRQLGLQRAVVREA